MKGKKGNAFNGLASLAISISVVTIVLVVTFLIITESRDQIKDIEGRSLMSDENGTAAWNATTEITDAVDDIPGWIPLIVLTAIGMILIGMVVMFKKTSVY